MSIGRIDGLESMKARMQAMSDAMTGTGASGVNNTLGVAAPASTMGDGKVDFQAVLKDAVRQVSDAQNVAQNNVQAFSTGSNEMTLEEVMVSLQKANLAFQGMIAVRNKLVDAYRDVTNMQV